MPFVRLTLNIGVFIVVEFIFLELSSLLRFDIFEAEVGY